MQRITTSIAGAGLAARTSRVASSCCPWMKTMMKTRTDQPAACRRQYQWACVLRGMCSKRRHAGGLTPTLSWKLRNPRRNHYAFVCHKYRLYSTEEEEDKNEARRTSSSSAAAGHPNISVVGVPDPITWIRCKVLMHLLDLYFELGVTSVDFDNGVKQALVHVSSMMSKENFRALNGIVSDEMLNYIEKKCKSLTDAQKQQLAVSLDDIIFIFPEDVSVFYDQHGRSFCFIVMRFWLLSALDGPDDPEGSKIFKVTSKEEDGSQKKIVTAVYEFHREMTRGAAPDWTVTNVWHWHWKLETG